MKFFSKRKVSIYSIMGDCKVEYGGFYLYISIMTIVRGVL